MPKSKNVQRAKAKTKSAKGPMAKVKEFVREELDELRRGKLSARSAKPAAAARTSKTRRTKVKLSPSLSKRATRVAGRKPAARRKSAEARARASM